VMPFALISLMGVVGLILLYVLAWQSSRRDALQGANL